jgi:tetratricopeptide (TPR) repeat protein
MTYNLRAMSLPTTEDIVRQATAAFNAGRRDEARRLCEQGLTRTPGDAMLSHLLAAVLFSAGELPPARLHIEASLANRPDRAPAQLLAARIARGLGDFDAALTHLDRVLALSPQREALFEKARTLDAAGLKPHAREAWRAILKAMPQNPEAAARLGRLASEDGDHQTARSLLERANTGEAPASAWFDLGVVCQDLRDHAAAAEAYRKALDIKPDYAEAALNLGIALQDCGNPDRAMRAYADAYRLRPATFGRIAMALTTASHGRLWLDEAALRRALDSQD